MEETSWARREISCFRKNWVLLILIIEKESSYQLLLVTSWCFSSRIRSRLISIRSWSDEWIILKSSIHRVSKHSLVLVIRWRIINKNLFSMTRDREYILWRLMTSHELVKDRGILILIMKISARYWLLKNLGFRGFSRILHI